MTGGANRTRAGTAAERLRAATEVAGDGGRLLVHPTPEVAAEAILDHLEAIGVADFGATAAANETPDEGRKG